jgi:signal transduction histidine kinase
VSAISGSTAYHILILSGLGILLGAALARRGTVGRRGPAHDASVRWAIASGMLVGVQGLRLVTAAWAPASVFLPLLDRLFTVLLPALMGWAALGPGAGEAADRALIGAVVVSGIWFAADVILGASAADFNISLLDAVWSLMAVVVGAAALAALLFRRPPQWGVFVGAVGILLAGDIAHIVVIPFTDSSAPFVLLAEALAVPLFTIGAIWSFLREPRGFAATAEQDETIPPSRSLSAFVELEQADSATAYAASLTRAVASLLRAEYCLLLTPPSDDGLMAIGAGYDTIHSVPVLGVLLEAQGCPVLTQAMARGRSVHLPGGTHSPDARTILRGLGLGGRSPGLLVPLPAEGKTVAGLLLLSPREQREWDDATRLTLEQVAPSLGARLQAWTAPAPRPADAVTLELEHARRRIADLEARPPQPAAPAELIGVDDLRNELDEARRTIEILEGEAARMRATPAAAEPAADEAQRTQAELALALEALADSRKTPSARAGAAGPALPARPEPSTMILNVRQPLTAISGYTELLLGESIGLLGTNQRRFLERIRLAVRRMDEELAALSNSLSASASSPPTGSSDLATLIEQALEGIHADLRAKGLSVRVDLPPSPMKLPGNPVSIRTIVSNLLANAVDVTPSGREILMTVLPSPDDGLVLLTVSDDGRGVPASDLGRVFASEAWEDPIPGLGRDVSALANVKSLTESLGGRVWVESRAGGGTRFSVLLPSPATS